MNIQHFRVYENKKNLEKISEKKIMRKKFERERMREYIYKFWGWVVCLRGPGLFQA